MAEEDELNGIMEYELKRINEKEKEILDFGIKINVENDNYKKWEIILTAPEDSDYKGGIYKVEAEFLKDYPLVNPKFKFKTKIFHCNVDDDGNLKVNWLLKGMKIDYILPRLLTLFYLQDTSVDKDSERCKLYENNKEEFKKKILENVEETKK